MLVLRLILTLLMRMKTVVPLPQMSETEICNTGCEKSGKMVPCPK